MKPVYIFLLCICLLACCNDSKAAKRCRPISVWSSACRGKKKRAETHFQNYPDSPQDDEKRAMLQLRDEKRKFLAMLLKEGRQEKQKRGGSNQKVYGSYPYDYDSQRYF